VVVDGEDVAAPPAAEGVRPPQPEPLRLPVEEDAPEDAELQDAAARELGR
jgi:hypothetical protein